MTSSAYREMIYSIVIPGNLSYEERSQRYQPLTNFLKNDVPEKLYRFRECKDREISEFEQNILGFAPAYRMNDDFDGLLYFDKDYIRRELNHNIAPEIIREYFNAAKHGSVVPGVKSLIPEEIFNRFVDLMLNLPSEEMRNMISEFLNFVTDEFDNRMLFLSQVTQNAKVACLTTEIESPAMWGYYAKGTGFAVSYDFRDKTFEKYCPLPVIYSDDRLNATEYANWLFQQQTLQRVFNCANAPELYQILQHSLPCPDEFMCGKILIHKATAWKPEKEWRIIYFNIGGDSEEYPHVIKKPSALYLGRHIKKEDKERLCQIANKHNIPVYQMAIFEEDSKYRLHPIKI